MLPLVLFRMSFLHHRMFSKFFREWDSCVAVAAPLPARAVVSSYSTCPREKKRGGSWTRALGAHLPYSALAAVISSPRISTSSSSLQFRPSRHREEVEELDHEYEELTTERNELLLKLEGLKRRRQLEVEVIRFFGPRLPRASDLEAAP